MMNALLLLVQWTHLLAAATWFGGVVIATFVIVPTILAMSPLEARNAYTHAQARMQRVMPLAGPTTILMGILRGTVFGPIKTWGVLFGTSYGHWFLAAIGLTVVIAIHGARTVGRYEAHLWDADKFRPGGAAYARRSGVTQIVLMSAVMACMVAMRFGL